MDCNAKAEFFHGLVDIELLIAPFAEAVLTKSTALISHFTKPSTYLLELGIHLTSCIILVKSKKNRALDDTPSQSYGVSLAT